jgi:hypothetical protein
MKIKILAIVILALFQNGYSQVAVGYFPFQSVVSLSTNTEKAVWLDYKLETNSFSSNLNMEISPKWNFKRREFVNYYVGAGIAFNPVYVFSNLPIVNGSFLDFGARIKPLKQLNNFQLILELSPYVNADFAGGNIRSKLGLAWNFGK